MNPLIYKGHFECILLLINNLEYYFREKSLPKRVLKVGELLLEGRAPLGSMRSMRPELHIWAQSTIIGIYDKRSSS